MKDSGPQHRRGSVLLELALSVIVLVLLAAGALQFGYAFYAYGQLQRAVRNGARFASLEPYPTRTPACLERQKERVRRFVVYGDPAPGKGRNSCVPGLSPERVEVVYHADEKGVPVSVEVAIRGFRLASVFSTYELDGAPAAAAPFTGRYAPNGCPP
jgi:Flp pilus assembly protein TadG